MHAASGVLDTGYDDTDYMPLLDLNQMEVEVVGLQPGDVEHQVYGQNLPADKAGIHSEWFLNQKQVLILLHYYAHWFLYRVGPHLLAVTIHHVTSQAAHVQNLHDPNKYRKISEYS